MEVLVKLKMKSKTHAIGKALGITLLLLLPAGSAVASPYAYITNIYNDSVSVIDTATNNVIDTVDVELILLELQ